MGGKHRVVSEQVKKWKTGVNLMTGDKYTTRANNVERPRVCRIRCTTKVKEKKRMIRASFE